MVKDRTMEADGEYCDGSRRELGANIFAEVGFALPAGEVGLAR